MTTTPDTSLREKKSLRQFQLQFPPRDWVTVEAKSRICAVLVCFECNDPRSPDGVYGSRKLKGMSEAEFEALNPREDYLYEGELRIWWPVTFWRAKK